MKRSPRSKKCAAAQLLPERRERRAGLYTLDRHRHYGRGVRRFRRLRGQERGGPSIRRCVHAETCVYVMGCIYMHPLRTRTQRSCERTHLRLHTLGVAGAYTHPLCTRTPPPRARLGLRRSKRKRRRIRGETYAPICRFTHPTLRRCVLAETDDRQRLCRWRWR